MFLETPDVYVAAAVMTIDSFYNGKGDIGNIFKLLIKRPSQ